MTRTSNGKRRPAELETAGAQGAEDGGAALRVELSGSVLRVTINRPGVRNALSRATIAELKAVFDSQARNQDLKIAILTGEGDRAFAAGGDLKDLQAVQTLDQATAMAEDAKSAFQAIRSFPVPVIAALNGDALGGGAELAVACDMRVADAHARIGFIQGRLNITTAWGGGHDLIRILGAPKALRLLSRSEMLDAKTAHSLGLIDCVAKQGESLEAALERFCKPILDQASHVLRAFKAMASEAKNANRNVIDRLETKHFGDAWIHDDHWAAADRLLSKKA